MARHEETTFVNHYSSGSGYVKVVDTIITVAMQPSAAVTATSTACTGPKPPSPSRTNASTSYSSSSSYFFFYFYCYYNYYYDEYEKAYANNFVYYPIYYL